MGNSSWWSDPIRKEAAREKMRMAALRRYNDPERGPEERRRRAEKQRAWAKDHKEEVAAVMDRMRAAITKESRAKAVRKLREWFKDPENRQKHIARVQEAMEDPEVRRRRGKAVLAAKRTPEARRQAREAMLSRFDSKLHHERTKSKPKQSKYEIQVAEFISNFYHGPIALKEHIFPDSKNSELDIYLPELKLAVEVQGDYWHSRPEQRQRDLKKQDKCLNMGISLFVLWVSDWKTKYSDEREATEQALKSFLQLRMKKPEADPDIAFSHEDVPLYFGGVEQGPIEGLH